MLPRLDMTPPSRVSPAWGASGPHHEAATRVEGIDRHAGYSEGVARAEGRQATLAVHWSATSATASSALICSRSPPLCRTCSLTGLYGETAIGSSRQWLHQLGQIAISQPSLFVQDSRGVNGAGLCSAPQALPLRRRARRSGRSPRCRPLAGGSAGIAAHAQRSSS